MTDEWLEELCDSCGRPLGDHHVPDGDSESSLPLCPLNDGSRWTPPVEYVVMEIRPPR